MRKYYVIQGDFANTYTVWSAENESTIRELVERGAERITKKEAKRLCDAEKERRMYGGNGGFASAEIRDAELEL